jgi:hypothetical protein
MSLLDTLGNLISLCHRKRKKVVLFLGAQASIESGNEEIDSIIDRVIQEHRSDLTQISNANRYEVFYETFNDMPQDLRHLVLSDLFQSMEPTEGYVFLAELVKRGYFDVVITTNFDNLLETSFTEQQLVPGRHYSVYIVGSDKEAELRHFLRRPAPHIKVLKLYGDLGKGVILLTPEDTLGLPEEIEKHIRKISEEIMLFVGYGKRDKNVFQMLSHEGESVWWASPAALSWENQDDRQVLQFLLNRRSDSNILCGDPAQFDNFFRSLYKCLTDRELPERQVVGSWRYLLDLARQQTSKYLGYIQSTIGGRKYISATYCRRICAEEKLDDFLSGDRTGLILIGDSGVGKTNLLCRLAEHLLEDGNVTLLYNCAGSLALDIESEVRKDLFVGESVSCLSALEKISQEAVRENKHLVVLFDAINEFHYENTNRTADLLKNIDNLIGKCRFTNIKFILSCRTSTWNHLNLFGQTELNWGAYYPDGDERVLTLERFTTEEFEHAYPRYQEVFGLRSELSNLSERTKTRCQDPLLLRMTAEVYKDKDELIASNAPTVTVFKDYYETKVRKPPASDEVFLEELVVEMGKNETDSLPVLYLQRHEMLTKHVTEDLDCAYQRLKDVGVLMEIPGDEYTGALVKFTYDRVFEYTLARHFIREQMTRGGLTADLIERLVLRSRTFPSLWGAARTILLLKFEQNLFVRLANSQHYEIRELIADTFVSLHEDEPDKALNVLTQILRQPSDDAKRVALKAAYTIGPDAKDIFIQGASEKSEAVRSVVSDYLYLVLKGKPYYGNLIWDELLSQISIRAVRRSGSILQTLIEVGIKTFIDQSDNPQAVQRVSETWHQITVDKLPVARNGVIGQISRQLLFPIVSQVAKTNIIETMFFTEYAPPDDFFGSEMDKNRAESVLIHYLDNRSALEDILPFLIEMLESPILFNHGLAIVILGSECIKAPQKMLPAVRDVFEQLSGAGRLWILMQFAYFSSMEVPDGYLEMLEEFTERFVEENRNTFISDPWGIYDTLYIPLLALGVAYCKRDDSTFPLFTRIIQEAEDKQDFEVVEKCILGLAPIGFHFPNEILSFIEKTVGPCGESEYLPALIQVLATIRTLHADQVETFLLRTNASESLAKEVRTRMEPDLVKRYVDWVGMLYTGLYSIANLPFFGSWLLSNVYLHASRCDSIEEIAKLVARDLLQLLADNDYYIHRVLH